jgi:hypothetical protein
VRDAIVAAVRAARAQTREQYEACRAEALRHTWDLNTAPVEADLEGLIRG